MSSGRPSSDHVVDAMLLATRNGEVSQSFPIHRLERLAEFAAQGRAAQLHARFQMVDGRCAIAGQVTAVMKATCQRCLQPMDLSIDDRFFVLLVRSEQEMNDLPEAQDAVIASAEHFDLANLTEEQLLLAMPLAPLHQKVEQCEVNRAIQHPRVEKSTPFANLRELMNK